MYKTCEDIYIRNIENGIRGIRLGSKKPEEIASSISTNFNRLSEVNQGMYEDLMKKYENVVNDYKNRRK